MPLLDLASLMQIPLCFALVVCTCALVGSCILNANTFCVLHWLCVGHAIDFYIAFNCIACLNDHLLIKCSLWSFFNDCPCLIKICLTIYIMFIILIALYLLI